MRNKLLLLLSLGLTLLGSNPALAQSATPLPPSLLNRNILPPSPEAAALGRFGAVPVSLYTGVPSIDIPLFTLPGRTVSVPVSLQYHGGGVRPEQVAPWTGMNWTLNAGGAITRTCRGVPDYGGYFTPTPTATSRPIPYGISTWCKNVDAADPTDYYDYISQILQGTQDSQPDLFSFNFMGYSGQIIFDQQGNAHTIPVQPIIVESPQHLNGNYWRVTTPDGAKYMFASPERTRNAGFTGTSAWYLTQIISAEHEQIDFQYQGYSTELTYPNPHTTTAISTQTVMADRYYCEICPRKLNISDRPTTFIDGQYLRRIVSATHRMDFLSTGNRLDQPGTRQLSTVRLTYLADSSRTQEFRLNYMYYDSTRHDRLFLRTVQKFGLLANGTQLAEPPYKLTYVAAPMNAQPLVVPTRGTYAVDRWGYYNAAPNINPFLHLNTQTYQILTPGANRNTNPATVTFGLLQRIQYPTGGYTDLEFESNDFSNIAGPLYATADSTKQVNADSDGTGTTPVSRSIIFTLTHAQDVRFTYTASPTGNDTSPVTQLDTHAVLELGNSATPMVFTQVNALDYPVPPAPNFFLRTLPAGTYRLVLQVEAARSATAQVLVEYQQRWPLGTQKQLGGGTRIRRTLTYDGLDHAHDLSKEYYYDNDRHTHSTGKLIHQPVFHTTSSHFVVFGVSGCLDPDNCCIGAPGEEWRCNYLIHSADDIAAASGSAQGSEVGYDTVTVVQRDHGTTLRTTSVFHNSAAGSVTLDDQAVENQGFIPVNFDTQNGLLLETLDYRVESNQDAFQPNASHLVRRVTQQYGSPTVPDLDIVGLSIGGSFGDLVSTNTEPCRTIVAQSYTTRVGWWPLTQTEETLYDENGQTHTTTTKLIYESAAHLQPSRKEVTASSGLTRLTRYKYALDYVPGADAGIQVLQSQHLVQMPVEQQQWVRYPGQPAQWLGGTVTRFGTTATGIAVAQRLYQATLAAPQNTLVEATAADQRFLDLLPSPAYELRASMRHNANGTLAQQALAHDQPTTYLWGYKNLHPIAEAKSVPYPRIAFTSFEPDASGRWRYDSVGTHRVAGGYTGRWAYQLDGTASGKIDRYQLPAGSYELTYWASIPMGISLPGLMLTNGTVSSQNQVLATGTNDWKLYRSRFQLAATGSVSLNGQSGRLDELRLYPVGTQFISYTYDPLAGTTSRTDQSGHTVLYEYDALGRLVRTRDEQGRILGQQQYHYAGQP